VDANRFDDFLRALARNAGSSRRDIMRSLGGITLGGSLGAWLGLADADAKRKKRKKKKKKKKRKKDKNRCTPACTECETCTNGACVNRPNGTACSDGACRFGECEPCGADEQVCCPDSPCSGRTNCVVGGCCLELSCGGEEEACCVDGVCDEGQICVSGPTGQRCAPDTTPCGVNGSPCCVEGAALVCAGDLVCIPPIGQCGDRADCGAAADPCCVDGTSSICDAGLQCGIGGCVPSCGAEAEPCCIPDTSTIECDAGLVCAQVPAGSGATCIQECGGEGQPCCFGRCDDGCDGSLECSLGLCVEA
jgi:hypothetical protein